MADMRLQDQVAPLARRVGEDARDEMGNVKKDINFNKLLPHTETPLSEHRQKTTHPDGTIPCSNAWPDPVVTQSEQAMEPEEVPFTEKDRRHMEQDLHRNVDDLVHRQAEAQERMQAHVRALKDHTTEGHLADMAAGVEAGPDRSAPKPASEEDVNRLAAEEQYKEVRLRNLSSDAREPTSKATRGYGGAN